MSLIRSSSILAIATVAALCVVPVHAQWSSDPMQNLAVGDKPNEQVLPKIAGMSDGGSYICWFDHASGNYDVYLQRLDAGGNELWPHNGVLVSSHTSLTSLVDWDLMCDAEDHAVIVFSDARAGTDLDIYAYRIDRQGALEWGPDGITLSANNEYEPAPRVAQADDGDFIFVWARLPSPGDGTIVIQRVDAFGNQLYGPSGVVISGAPGEDPAFCDVVGADNGGFIVMWVRDISTFGSPRHLRAQKFDAAGTAQWGSGPVLVYDAASMPIAYNPIVQRDGAGGAYFAWHSSVGVFFDSYVQHVDVGGTELFGHNGVKVSTRLNRHKIDPTLSVVAATGELVVFWNERNSAQSQWGIGAQKLSAAGVRSWTDDGLLLLPVDGINKSSPRSVPTADAATMIVFDMPNTPSSQARLIAARVDANGTPVWFPTTSVACSNLSSKDKLAVIAHSDGVVRATWTDQRNDGGDVYAQDINPDGSIGFGGGCLAVNFCETTPNSATPGALMSASGSTSILANDLVLTTERLPPNAFGRYFYGPAITHVPFGNGVRCVGNGFFRLPPQTADGAGVAVFAMDYAALPPLGPIGAGDVEGFQFWYRNPAGGGANFNASNGINASFCP